ncbi:hypothetical protein DFH28DRAFT_984946 [Melampsora americana]|nr:hypothetical protein DFH28DRAFT_984946 [Melampsora americana]
MIYISFINFFFIFILILCPLILTDHIPGHVVMFFEMHGDKVHVVPQKIRSEDHKNKKEFHSKRSEKEESSEQDPYTITQSNSDNLNTLLKNTLESIPTADHSIDDDDDDDDGKVENHIPGYKNNPIVKS